MSNSSKDTNLKEKLKQALTSTFKVISDDFDINNRSEKSKNSKKPDFYELDHFESVDVDTPFDFFIAEQINNKYFKNKKI